MLIGNDRKSPNYKGLTFLIIEDNIHFLDLLSKYLGKHGASYETAENGQLGLQEYLKCPMNYDIILMDIEMPILDGIESTKQIRESKATNAKTIPIIAISGKDLKHNHNFSVMLKKPFDMQELPITINKLIANK